MTRIKNIQERVSGKKGEGKEKDEMEGKNCMEREGKGNEREEKQKGKGRKEKRGWDVFNLHNFVNLMYSTEPTDSVTDIV